MHLVIRFIVNAIALYCIAKYVPGFNHNITIVGALIAAIIFGLVNALLGPILRFITFPITFLTLGLFSIVVNYILFVVVVWIAPGFHTTGEINPWLADLYGAVIMMIVSTIMHGATKQPEAATR
ncbi:MAG TPA: phage holin family protein [Candidatus Baltobacteraceae bacterium]|jgi:putative membrane protein|nr:phage holin family protein [Candidatus Baltobacteraceae bacterium]